jgi:hypothetical protein
MKDTRVATTAGLAWIATLGLVMQGAASGQGQQEQVPTPGLPSPAQIAAAVGQGKEKDDKEKPDFPEFKEVSKDFVKVVSTADGSDSMWTVWRRDKDNQLLAELPRDFAIQRYFFAMTVARGSQWAGLQGSDMYLYWKRIDKNLALIEPNLGTRSTGDKESKASVERLFTDRVILDIPIVAMGPGGGPVIDLDALLVGQASKFFGPQAERLNAALAMIKEAKAFPENIEVSVEAPLPGGSGRAGGMGENINAGRLQTYHYSISTIRSNPDYKPREADERVGYFTTVYRDLGKLGKVDKWVRYINRWHIEKADPKLKMSPPKQPIVFYIENEVPVRYRRWVRDGILMWNKAYEQVGIAGAIEVYQQDATSGAHMEKDPEDVRYNFIRWLSNDVSTAIGPSRANPLTGQILDADIVLTDGWIRAFWTFANEVIPDLAMESMNPQTLAWLESRPQWDPRVRLASPSQRPYLAQQQLARGVQRFGGHPAMAADPTIMGDDEFDGLRGRNSQMNGMCLAAKGRAMDMAMVGMSLGVMDAMLDADEDDKPKGGDDEPKKDDPKDAEQKLDGIPEWFIGPMLADLVAHEVGHTLGLRHNFKASAVYSMAQINSAEWKGKKPIGASVMDYNALPNIAMSSGSVQGDFGMIDIGAYDKWAIEYGYTMEDTKKVLARVAEPELLYATDEDTWGPDPLARRRDLGSDPLTFAQSRMALAQTLRGRILEKFVKEGDSWSKARRGYVITLNQQLSALGTMANWIGGAHVNRDKKGDPNARDPITPVAAAKQRDALKFVVDNAFKDEAFGLTTDLLNKMTVDKWWDDGGINDIFEDETWPIHDRILGVQASVLTMVMNPTTLGRVFDNEYRVPADQDMITVPEVLNTVTDSIWTEVQAGKSGSFTERKPMISSLRRNLQREQLERLIDLTLPAGLSGSAANAVATVATTKLRELHGQIVAIAGEGGDKAKGKPSGLDMYSYAHLSEARERIEKALDAIYIYNTDQIGGGGGFTIMFGNDGNAPQAPRVP